jgi:YHS domain-containing protein
MKNLNIKLLSLVIIITLMTSSCAFFRLSAPVYVVCPVCNMSVDRSDAFIYKYNGTKYLFDKYECKEVFKMDPEKIIKNHKSDVKVKSN